MKIEIPEYALIALIGPSGAGKSTFARRHFLPGEVLSSDEFRRLVGNDENRLDLSDDAFDALYYVLQKRLDRGLLTVIDATNVTPDDRRKLIDMARKNHVFAAAIVIDTPLDLCIERNKNRPERAHLPAGVPARQQKNLRQAIRLLGKEGFRYIFHLKTQEQVDAAEIVREPLYFNKKHEYGPFDIIGDVHGCFDELLDLLRVMDWQVERDVDSGRYRVNHPHGRKAIFVGDYVDRGPDSPQVLRLVMDMQAAGVAYCLPGNHDVKLLKWLEGRPVQLTHGLQQTVEQLTAYDDEFRKEVREFIDGLVSHLIFDEGRLVVSHAGIKEKYIGRTSKTVRSFCLYGDTNGETDEYGMPVRLDWAADYRGSAVIVYGHTPTFEPQWANNTTCIDTGCVFGGRLTALRYPERKWVSVPARRMYYEPSRPIVAPDAERSLQSIFDELPDAQALLKSRHFETRMMGMIKVGELEAAAAFETLCRFTVDPKWLIYLPPTMSPADTSKSPDYLELPQQAFEFYQKSGVETVVCQEKHMGSRAIFVVCKDEKTARSRFGVSAGAGICYTRTGRRFFKDEGQETDILQIIRTALDRSGFWESMSTDWVCFEGELMPWSAKAQQLLQNQYAAVSSAALLSLPAVESALRTAAQRLPEAEAQAERFATRQDDLRRYAAAWKRYCWPVSGVSDLKLAPFHLLAVEGRTFFDQTHAWHLDQLKRIVDADDSGVMMNTRRLFVQVNDPDSVAAATDWWHELTGGGGEGMVVKPLDYLAKNEHGWIQPAIKIRGREYLRIIYGPEYVQPEHIERLRARGLNSKRRMALQELAFGVESLNQFVEKAPMRKVHEGVFGILAIESAGGDPRL